MILVKEKNTNSSVSLTLALHIRFSAKSANFVLLFHDLEHREGSSAKSLGPIHQEVFRSSSGCIPVKRNERNKTTGEKRANQEIAAGRNVELKISVVIFFKHRERNAREIVCGKKK